MNKVNFSFIITVLSIINFVLAFLAIALINYQAEVNRSLTEKVSNLATTISHTQNQTRPIVDSIFNNSNFNRKLTVGAINDTNKILESQNQLRANDQIILENLTAQLKLKSMAHAEILHNLNKTDALIINRTIR